MSQITLTFNLGCLSADAQEAFMIRVADLNNRFFNLAEKSFVEMKSTVRASGADEDGGSAPPPAPAATAEKALEDMTLDELRPLMRALQGKSTDVRHTPKFPKKADIIAEIQRLRAEASAAPVPASAPASAPAAVVPSHPTGAEEVKKERKNPWAGLSEAERAERVAKMQAGRQAKKAERKMSGDSLDAPAPAALPAPVPAPAPAPAAPASVDGGASETSSQKKARKNPWAGLSEEERAAKIAKMQAGREAKKSAKGAGAGSDSA